MTNLFDEWDQDQKLMVDIIYLHYAAKGKWPVWRYVRRAFARESPSDPKAVRDSFPVIGDRRALGPTYSAIHFSPQDLSDDAEYRLCLVAGLQHFKFQTTATKVVEIIKYLAEGMRTIDPDVESITKTSSRLAREMRWDPYAMPNLPDFLHREPMNLITSSSKPEGEKWQVTLGDEGLTPYSQISDLQGYVEKTVELVLAIRAEQSAVPRLPAVSAVAAVAPGVARNYVDEGLIRQLENLQHPAWHLGRLIAMLRELNSNYAAEQPYACIMLCRAIIDHVPPVFGFKSFAEVTNKPGVSQNDRNFLKLLSDHRFVANHALHHHISKKADVIALYDVPQRMGVNTLVQLVLDELA